MSFKGTDKRILSCHLNKTKFRDAAVGIVKNVGSKGNHFYDVNLDGGLFKNVPILERPQKGNIYSLGEGSVVALGFLENGIPFIIEGIPSYKSEPKDFPDGGDELGKEMRYHYGSWSRSCWLLHDGPALEVGELFYKFPAGEEPGYLLWNSSEKCMMLMGNKKVYNFDSDMEVISDFTGSPPHIMTPTLAGPASGSWRLIGVNTSGKRLVFRNIASPGQVSDSFKENLFKKNRELDHEDSYGISALDDIYMSIWGGCVSRIPPAGKPEVLQFAVRAYKWNNMGETYCEKINFSAGVSDIDWQNIGITNLGGQARKVASGFEGIMCYSSNVPDGGYRVWWADESNSAVISEGASFPGQEIQFYWDNFGNSQRYYSYYPPFTIHQPGFSMSKPPYWSTFETCGDGYIKNEGFGTTNTEFHATSNNMFQFGYDSIDSDFLNGIFVYKCMNWKYDLEGGVKRTLELPFTSNDLRFHGGLATSDASFHNNNNFLITTGEVCVSPTGNVFCRGNVVFFVYEDRDNDKIGVLGIDIYNNKLKYHYRQDHIGMWPGEQKIWIYGNYIAFNTGPNWIIVR